ncbi:T9SS type A sorting domain-containing protein [Hymenobacter sp. 15J16-1T3B]|uniref:T9SS type A sorting domain-containing protein n=1 Tax=Hymenobacter sp. 15J16-1T3B TaxID=2886941 RepID=UPI001D12FD06|nr:T9SS type A sorting domain-containing protein [Hymenobacter sp. 15J16-1T3B]MCC3156780.1 T9SS type A sorting domain-containing protein [Hymenobacter sp. 15J16-1T3B]
MKKTLLSLACAVLFGAAAHAQTQQPWSIVSVGSAVPTNYITEKIVTVNAATVWALYREIPAAGATTAPPARTFARTIDGGTTWTGGAINIPLGLNVANISPIDGNTAWLAAFATGPSTISQQGIYKTTDGGQTWTRQATATFSTSDSFPNGVHFFDANNGVCFGDPTPHGANARLEVYTTTNGGTTWTRNSTNAPQVQNLQEYGLAGSYFALGNTIWHGGVSDDGTGPTSGIGARLYKSTDRGLTWTAANTDLPYAVNYIAFTNANQGLLSSGYELLSTNNGGTTNSTLLYSGNFRSAGMDAVPGLANTYISVGVPEGGTSANNGSSISYDGGATWTNMLTGTASINQYEIDMFSNAVGYTGAVAQGTQAAPTVNVAGITKLNTVLQLPTASKNSEALRGALQVFPNPSNDGRFSLNVNLPGATKRDLTVTDALGRVVKQIKLNATGAAVQNQSLDLSQCKAGVYTLRLVTEQGTTVEKLVIK